MRFFTLVKVTSLFAAAQCTANNYCGAREPPTELVTAHHTLGARESASGTSLTTRDNLQTLDIDLYLHVIESEETKGQITDESIEQQASIIVDTYRKYNIMFNYKGVDHTVNNDWAITQNDTLSRGLALRKGDYLAMNVYVVNLLDNNALGICTFPHNWDVSAGIALQGSGDENSDDAYNYLPKDGCTIAGFTLPGQVHDGDAMGGLTAVHEIGHWLGLFHTFQGNSCDGPGDLIDDTRIQLNATSGCPAHRISCPNIPFAPTPEDPFHNFMDYSADNCTTQFTNLQIIRVFGLFPLFRASQNNNESTTINGSAITGGSNSSTPVTNSSFTDDSYNASTLPSVPTSGTSVGGNTSNEAFALLTLLICSFGVCGKQG